MIDLYIKGNGFCSKDISLCQMLKFYSLTRVILNACPKNISCLQYSTQWFSQYGNSVKTGQRNHTWSAAIIKVQHCFPQDLQLFDVSKPFSLPYHLQYSANTIAKGILSFHDRSIISDTDLKALLELTIRLKSNFYIKLKFKHLTGLWEMIWILSSRE